MTKWFVIGTDERLKILAKTLSKSFPAVYYKNQNNWNNECNDILKQFQPNHIVLPIQPLNIDTPCLQIPTETKIYAGKLNDTWHTLLQNNDIFHYLEDESFIWQNAKLTAEAFLSHFYNSKQAINGKTFIVTGFGRVAKMVSTMIQNIGGKVIIAVRSDIQLNEAKAFFYEAIYLSEIDKAKGDFLINTIPAQWLSNELINMPIYDLASAPGCLAKGTSKENYEWLPALPGKFFPKDAATVLHNAILAHYNNKT